MKQGRNSCILFFAGWGMDPRPFRQIPVSGHDLLMVYDYSVLSPSEEIEKSLAVYKHLHLVAWSMGVWAAAVILAGRTGKLASATAVNGTLLPIDAQCGIDPDAYAAMIDNFSLPTLHAFYASMFSSPEEEKTFFNRLPARPFNNILDELVQLKQYYTAQRRVEDIFDYHIVGSRDRIFPARNQVRCWGRDRCTIIRAPHFPFYEWPAWDRIIPYTAGIS